MLLALDLSEMKLHNTTIEKLIKLYTTYGGYPEERKLRQALQEISLDSYDQQTGRKQTVLVLSEDLQKYTR